MKFNKDVTRKGLKAFFLTLCLALYLFFIISHFTYARPMGASVTNISTETYGFSPQSRTDLGGTITTLQLSSTQQNYAWKAYVGNITGTLVLKNSDGYSIFEWPMNSSAMSGYVFVSRNGSLEWLSASCANSAVINSEQAFLGINSSSTFSINKTFNYTIHKSMTLALVATIQNSTCPSLATYVNGTAQQMSENAYFQEILLSVSNNLVYATFIDQDAFGFDNNATAPSRYDFQIIVAENSSSPTGNVYYFYAEITS